MFLKKCFNKKTGKTQLSIVQGYRVNGVVKNKVIENIGYLEELREQYEDPIAHFKEIVKKMNEEEINKNNIEINLLQKLPDNAKNRKSLGYAVVKNIYNMLGLYDLWQYKQRFVKAKFNLNSIFSLLIFTRFLFPSSIKQAFEHKTNYFENYNFELEDMYRALEYFDENSEEIQKLLAQKTKEKFGRKSQLGYYDVTNYYFEIPYEDEDLIDKNGKIKKGFRKKGPSKEHRPDPIVQMGLLMDSAGIPIAYNLFSGGESEKVNMLPTIRRVKKDYGINRIIVVADKGLNTSENTAQLSGKNHDDMKYNDGYIYGQSILMSDKAFKEWILDPKGYIVDKDNEITFIHKSRIIAKSVTVKNIQGDRNIKREIYQKQMVYYSEKYAKKQYYDRVKVIDKAKKLIANPDQYNKATSRGVAGYIKNLHFSPETGEIIKKHKLELDIDKITEESKYDGYYCIVTSEKDMPDAEIHNAYKGLWKIEESFKILKHEFDARPIFVQTEAHIKAHFLICYVALVIGRYLELLLKGKHNIDNIRKTLRNYQCSYLEQNYYLFDYNDEILKVIGKIFNWEITQKYMQVANIKKILKIQN